MNSDARHWVLRGVLALSLTGAFVLTGAPAALASTGGVSGGVLTYTATTNENNDIEIWPTSATPGAITLDDYGTASLVAGAGCSLVAGELRCTGVTSIVHQRRQPRPTVRTGPPIDLPVTYNASSGNDEGYGGSGNDTFDMAAGFDYVEANGGDDTIAGGTEDDDALMGDGDDAVSMDDGSDTVFGEAGNDTLHPG